MKKRRHAYPDSEDMFADTRMTLGGHIEDLRTHLLRAIYGFVIGLVASLAFGQPVLQFIAHPVEVQLLDYWTRYYKTKIEELMQGEGGPDGPKVSLPKFAIPMDKIAANLARRFKLPPPPAPADQGFNPAPAFERMFRRLGIDLPETEEDVIYAEPDPRQYYESVAKNMLDIRPPTLRTFSVQEAFVVFIKVCMMTGLVISSPWVFYQIWSFIAAGLYPHEKRLVNVYLPYSIILFLAGVFLCEFFVIPKAVGALLWFNEWLGMEPDLRLNEWLGFAILMPLVFGISFQTPLVMLFTERIGLFDVPTFRGFRRMAYFVMFVIAMVVIPATDAVSMLLLAVPMCLLYEFGILLCLWQPKHEFTGEDSESQELIEA